MISHFNRRVRLPAIAPTPQGYTALLKLAAASGYCSGWAAHTFREQFGKWPNFTANGSLVRRRRLGSFPNF